jgi:alpha-D-ribose 1-methylphosphonate 5-triphosphate diphosphatase
MVSLNDHYPECDDADLRRHAVALRGRIAAPIEAIEVMERAAWGRRSEGEKQLLDLVDVCAQNNVPLASHDDNTEEQIRLSADRGVTISEFPVNIALCHLARSLGAGVLLGAPNLVRGGSHLGRISVAEAIAADAVDAICSDYHYPSLFCAPFLATTGLERAWSLVSSGPARLAGLEGRKGVLAEGADADMLLVDDTMAPGRTTAALTAVYRNGVEVFRCRS